MPGIEQRTCESSSWRATFNDTVRAEVEVQTPPDAIAS